MLMLNGWLPQSVAFVLLRKVGRFQLVPPRGGKIIRHFKTRMSSNFARSWDQLTNHYTALLQFQQKDMNSVVLQNQSLLFLPRIVSLNTVNSTFYVALGCRIGQSLRRLLLCALQSSCSLSQCSGNESFR